MHSAAQHERGCSAGRSPAPATSWSNSNSNSNSNSRSWFPAGSRGGSGCGGRRKPVRGGWAAASMPRTPPNRTHPAFDRFPRSVDPCHAWMNLCRISKSIGVRSVFQRKTDLAPGPHVVPGSVQPSPGNCQSWGGVGWQDRWRHGWRHRAPRGEGALLAKHCFASARTHSRQRLGRTAERGSRRVLPAHTAPPNQQKTRAALALALGCCRDVPPA